MSTTDELMKNAEAYAQGFDKGDLPMPPARKIAVLACMDARIIPTRLLGLEEGEAHVIRNAGGIVSDEEIRSLAISQHLLGTEEIVLIPHTDCGMLTFKDEEFSQQLRDATGEEPPFEAHSFSDVEEDLKDSVKTIEDSPFIRHKNVRGFIYEVETGRLREVAA
ncbi:MAG: carbonic anhydrase [Thermoleophilaceae bacterium]|nr:carbonic anhydrase [Thermoleophilaceae bacterium]